MTKYLSCAETAKLLRQALKEAFPGTKFSVQSKTYSGGASITVKWTDGPTSAQVGKIAAPFEGAYFDGMIDYKGTRYATLNGEPVRFGADFIFTSPGFSDGLLQAAITTISNHYGGNEPITVEQWRKGAGLYWFNSGGCDLGQAVHLWLCGRSEFDGLVPYQGIEPKASATLAAIGFAGDDGYGSGTVGRNPEKPDGEQAYKAQEEARQRALVLRQMRAEA